MYCRICDSVFYLELVLSIVYAHHQATISENEEVHYEIWKQRRVNYIQDLASDRDLNLNEEQLLGQDHSKEMLKMESVPQVMIDLFYKNLQNKNQNAQDSNIDTIVRSFTAQDIISEKEKFILNFDLSVINFSIEFPGTAILILTSNLSLGDPSKFSGDHVLYVNGIPQKIKSSLHKSTIDASIAVQIWHKNKPGDATTFKIILEMRKDSKGLEFFNPNEAILLVYTKANHKLEGKAELSELIHHEEQILESLNHRRGRAKRNAHLSNEVTGMVAPSYPSDDYEEIEEFTNDINRNLFIGNKLGIHGKQQNPHIRRHLAKKMWGPCRKRPFYVNFSEVKFDSWIIAPKGYQANECYGRCGYPLGAHLTPTKHAIMRAMLNGISPKKATRACCVPTKLEPISILYMDDHGVVTYKYNYGDMIVTECGCR